MTAFNIVRMRVKPGHEDKYLQLHRQIDQAKVKRMKKAGLRDFSIVKTGDRSFCVVGEWDSFDSIVRSRADMIEMLDGMRDILEDLGGGLGVTDPVSGEVVFSINDGTRKAAE